MWSFDHIGACDVARKMSLTIQTIHASLQTRECAICSRKLTTGIQTHRRKFKPLDKQASRLGLGLEPRADHQSVSRSQSNARSVLREGLGRKDTERKTRREVSSIAASRNRTNKVFYVVFVYIYIYTPFTPGTHQSLSLQIPGYLSPSTEGHEEGQEVSTCVDLWVSVLKGVLPSCDLHSSDLAG